ncbi:benzoate/H(+) symporter BenE family transporter [Novosphingobium sp.]|uniref:benzoate/H(+) symporter BenE family transporter n=1 Tax=Novosphingobium sp. TaxID=1874826 RepID=UPI0031E2E96E
MTRALPPLSAWSSAVIAALIGFGGTIALIVQAMQAMGASVLQTASAVTALCLGIALAGTALSWRLRIPVVLAWSTPGAALLAASGAASPVSWPMAVGAFVCAAVLMILLGAIPALGRLAERIPGAIASAMLAGILLPFCLGLFKVAGADPLLVTLILIVFLAARQRAPLYALLLALGSGAALSLLRGDLKPLPPGATLGVLSPAMPSAQIGTLIGIGVPLFLVTLVSQNLPGLLVLRTAGYQPKPAPLLTVTGIASLIGAPFGAHGVNLAAITAAICTSSDAHPDHARRWSVGLLYAGCYLVLALFSPILVRFFLALPHDVIAALTGLALIPALLGATEGAMAAREERDAAITTLLVTASGLTLFHLGAAFWGLAAGFVALGIRAALKR